MAAADIAFILLCTGLVFIMTPGLAFFYGGLLRKKNVISMMAMCFIAIVVVGLFWFCFGYSFAFAPDIGGGFIGGGNFLGLIGVDLGYYAIYSLEIPHMLFMVFQLMFAIITVAIVASPFAERTRFSSFIIFIVVWLLIVYSPIAHWVWGDGGWLRTLGALDFAGGTVVHINAGFSALAVAIVIKPRNAYRKEAMEPSKIPYVLLGAALLWLGWFGFNGGSALAANETAVLAMFNTFIASCAAGGIWLIIGWWQTGKASTLGLVTGVLAGLVAVTPAAGFIEPWAAITIGAIVGVLCYFALNLRAKSKIDETLDAFAIHGIGGIWGALSTGIFASVGAVGLIAGNPGQIVIQTLGVIVTVVYSFCVSFVIALIINKLVGLRVTSDEEYLGLDITQHGEKM
ncbi:MAG: ammonium transporter [Promethearchaeota archaeon]|nr:MAG: ammonium transporter [Candidatus Lokiarchaeota archaeon]